MATNIPVPNPRTYSSLDSIDYRDMEDNVFNSLSLKINPPLCYVKRTTSQNVNNSANTVITWDQVFADTGPMLDLGVDATKIIPNVAGRYKVIFGAYWLTNGGTGGRKIMWVTKNGTLMLRHESRQTSYGDKHCLATGGYVKVNGTTDYLQLTVFQDSGGAQNIGHMTFTGASDDTFMWIRWEGVN